MKLSEEEKRGMLEDGSSKSSRESFRKVRALKPGKKEFEEWLLAMHAQLKIPPSDRFVVYKNVKL